MGSLKSKVENVNKGSESLHYFHYPCGANQYGSYNSPYGASAGYPNEFYGAGEFYGGELPFNGTACPFQEFGAPQAFYNQQPLDYYGDCSDIRGVNFGSLHEAAYGRLNDIYQPGFGLSGLPPQVFPAEVQQAHPNTFLPQHFFNDLNVPHNFGSAAVYSELNSGYPLAQQTIQHRTLAQAPPMSAPAPLPQQHQQQYIPHSRNFTPNYSSSNYRDIESFKTSLSPTTLNSFHASRATYC